ncbi:MAG: hypothetical protein RBR01_06985 [Desulfobacterales bacterium]|jgi:hypothetical protein|nr:hypothetical protein [Desulfobacterales bacterium]MDD3081210.1 hypothetical protein [Desulfobacterales bacterium]MDD3950242.1 hypothetical protein [Desulfobacterales bacterium]MDD4462864.1 hypothetical protein [Desulfobacterales bacterium]MDY0378168.1 hypothetical protein [Desulfobacterales bacterium]
MSAHFRLNLQTRCDLEVREDLPAGRLDDEVHALQTRTGYLETVGGCVLHGRELFYLKQGGWRTFGGRQKFRLAPAV